MQIRIASFSRIVSGHLDGADIGLDLITPTEPREQRLEFSVPYLTTAPTVVVRHGTKVPDLATARKLVWGVVRSTTFEGDISILVAPEKPTVLFDGQQEMLAALRAGRIAAVMFDLPLAVAIARLSGGHLEAVAQLPEREALAVALPKSSPNRQAVDSAIRAFTTDGVIERLLNRWVGSDAANAESAIPLLHTTR